jgi:hypothetical protein
MKKPNSILLGVYNCPFGSVCTASQKMMRVFFFSIKPRHTKSHVYDFVEIPLRMGQSSFVPRRARALGIAQSSFMIFA